MKEYTVRVFDDRTEWRLNGKLHCEHGPAYITEKVTVWFQNNVYHRTDGPAIVYANGDKVWCRFGVRHRDDGPAVERADGTKEWWVVGIKFTEEQFHNIKKKSGEPTATTNRVVEIDGKKYKLVPIDNELKIKTVISRSGREKGTVVGSRRCTMEGCGAPRLIVKWSDGKTTIPCTRSMVSISSEEMKLL
jgi:hypothetical protein